MLLVAVTVLCVWLGFKVNAARRQREAVAALLKAGGHLSYDYQWIVDPVGKPPFDHKWDYDALPPGPAWLRGFLGEEYFREVIEVIFTRAVSEADLKQIAKLPSIWKVYLPGTRILLEDSKESRPIEDRDHAVFEGAVRLKYFLFDDASEVHGRGIRYLRNLKELLELRFRSSPLDDSAMENIGELTSLDYLEINNAKFTSAGFKFLRHLPNLKHLILSNTGFSDADAQYITSNRLRYLDLTANPIGDAGMKCIGRFKTLEGLFLQKTNVTDKGAGYLRNLSNIELLSLSDTAISDDALQTIRGLNKLKQAHLLGTKATPNGFRELKRALPTTQIFIAQGPWMGEIEQPLEVPTQDDLNQPTPAH